jgi:hypothetical protein
MHGCGCFSHGYLFVVSGLLTTRGPDVPLVLLKSVKVVCDGKSPSMLSYLPNEYYHCRTDSKLEVGHAHPCASQTSGVHMCVHCIHKYIVFTLWTACFFVFFFFCICRPTYLIGSCIRLQFFFEPILCAQSVQIKRTFPAGRVETKEVDETLRSIAIAVSTGKFSKICDAVWNHPAIRTFLFEKAAAQVGKEFKGVAKYANADQCTLAARPSLESLHKLAHSIPEVVTELRALAPLAIACLKSACGGERTGRKRQRPWQIAVMVAASVLLYQRSPRMRLFAALVGVELYRGSASKKVIAGDGICGGGVVVLRRSACLCCHYLCTAPPVC